MAQARFLGNLLTTAADTPITNITTAVPFRIPPNCTLILCPNITSFFSPDNRTTVAFSGSGNAIPLFNGDRYEVEVGSDGQVPSPGGANSTSVVLQFLTKGTNGNCSVFAFPTKRKSA